MEAGFIMRMQLFYGGNVDCYWILKPQDGCSNRGCTFLVERLGKNLACIYWGETENWKEFILNTDLFVISVVF